MSLGRPHDRMRSTVEVLAERDGLVVSVGHTAWETGPPERGAAVVGTARELGTEVTTVRDAVATG